MMRLGLGLGINAGGGGTALPSGALAAWDASQLASLYQDSAGTTPVTAAAQSVGRWSDLSGNAAHATQATAAARPTYEIGPAAVLFDGVDDHLTTTLIPGGAGTVAARFYTTLGTRRIFGARDTVTGDRCLLNLNASGQIAGGVGTQGNDPIFGGDDLRGGWHTGSLSWDGSTVTLYADGGLVYSGAQSGALPAVALMLGAQNDSGTAAVHFNGSIGAGAVYGRALSDAEHLQLHNAWSAIA